MPAKDLKPTVPKGATTAVIAQCTNPTDVRAALAPARAQGLPVAVRSGGHSVAGASLVEDGLVLDLRRMNAMAASPDGRTAVVGGGATWAAVDRACQAHGVATMANRDVPGWFTRSGCGRTRPATTTPGAGRAGCATTWHRGARVPRT
ncbi:hypothetical protein SUDANB95_04621 [Actinosynnema sp. ALI-1.44]